MSGDLYVWTPDYAIGDLVTRHEKVRDRSDGNAIVKTITMRGNQTFATVTYSDHEITALADQFRKVTP